MKTIPTTDLPPSAFVNDTSGIPIHVDDDPTDRIDYFRRGADIGPTASRDDVQGIYSDMRCKCGAVCDGVDPKQLRVAVDAPTMVRTVARVRIVACPMCPR